MREIAMNRRATEYDVIRVIATILVVIGHSTYLEMGDGLGLIRLSYSDYSVWIESFPIKLLQFFSSWVYSFHMPLFFMLSGACYSVIGGKAHYNNSLDILASNKAKKLLVPLFVSALLFMLPLKWGVGYYNDVSILTCIKSLLAGENGYGHLWFLLTIFWTFVFFYCIEVTIGLRSKFLCLISCFLLSHIVQVLCNKVYFVDKYLYVRALLNIKYFALGYYFDQCKKDIRYNALVYILGGGISDTFLFEF